MGNILSHEVEYHREKLFLFRSWWTIVQNWLICILVLVHPFRLLNNLYTFFQFWKALLNSYGRVPRASPTNHFFPNCSFFFKKLIIFIEKPIHLSNVFFHFYLNVSKIFNIVFFIDVTNFLYTFLRCNNFIISQKELLFNEYNQQFSEDNDHLE